TAVAARAWRRSSRCSTASTVWCSSSSVRATSCGTASCRTSSTPTNDIARKSREREAVTELLAPAVFSADEQRDVEVDVARWARLARLVLVDERVHERYGDDVEMSLLFVDEQTIAELNERFLGVVGPTDVLSFPMDEELPPGGRQPDQGGRGP